MMAEKDSSRHYSGLNRRTFLKSTDVAVAAGLGVELQGST